MVTTQRMARKTHSLTIEEALGGQGRPGAGPARMRKELSDAQRDAELARALRHLLLPPLLLLPYCCIPTAASPTTGYYLLLLAATCYYSTGSSLLLLAYTLRTNHFLPGVSTPAGSSPAPKRLITYY